MPSHIILMRKSVEEQKQALKTKDITKYMKLDINLHEVLLEIRLLVTLLLSSENPVINIWKHIITAFQIGEPFCADVVAAERFVNCSKIAQ